MVKIGLIGCGRITQIFHLKALLRLPQVRITALAEAVPDRLEQAAAQCPNAARFEHYEHMLATADTDAVVICLPTAMHAKAAMDSLAHGKHVYLEKPIATSLADADALVQAWRRSGLIGMTGFNFRFNTLYQEAREKIQSGTLGAMVCARSVFSSAARTLPAWKRKRATGGGVLLDLASHHFDLARYLFDSEIESIRAVIRSVRFENDTATVEAILSTGMSLQSAFTMCSIEEHSFAVYGVKGRIRLDRVPSRQVEITRPTMPYDRIRRVWDSFAALHPNRLLRSPWEPSFERALAAFAAAVETGVPTAPDFEDGYRSLAAVVAAEESAERGVPVAVHAAVPMASRT
jgi:myo-inositol 2-dehydrogenase/D-chiro-inositol 1-dehydrogenase